MRNALFFCTGFVLMFLGTAALCFSLLMTLPAHGEEVRCGPADREGWAKLAKVYGGTSTELVGVDAKAYLDVINEAGKSRFTSSDLLVLSAPNQAAVLLLIYGNKSCLVAFIAPSVHEAAMKATAGRKA